MKLLKIFAICLLLFFSICEQNILKFGAIPNEDTLQAQTANAHAIAAAIAKANSSESTGDARVVVIPKGKFYSLPIRLNHCYDIIL